MKPVRFTALPYRYTWDGEAKAYAVQCTLEVDDLDLHLVTAQGPTMAEARAAMDSAVDLTIKHWPPRTT